MATCTSSGPEIRRATPTISFFQDFDTGKYHKDFGSVEYKRMEMCFVGGTIVSGTLQVFQALQTAYFFKKTKSEKEIGKNVRRWMCLQLLAGVALLCRLTLITALNLQNLSDTAFLVLKNLELAFLVIS